jgi:hypothetical protein
MLTDLSVAIGQASMLIEPIRGNGIQAVSVKKNPLGADNNLSRTAFSGKKSPPRATVETRRLKRTLWLVVNVCQRNTVTGCLYIDNSR